MLFPSQMHEDLWIENWCDKCFQPDQATKRYLDQGRGCPILFRALQSDKKPVEWKLTRDQLIQSQYRCEKFLAKPPVDRRPKVEDQTASMFEADEADYLLVPVGGLA